MKKCLIKFKALPVLLEILCLHTASKLAREKEFIGGGSTGAKGAWPLLHTLMFSIGIQFLQ